LGLWKVLLRLSANPRGPSDTFGHWHDVFEHGNGIKYYCRQTDYWVQKLKTITLVDTETQAVHHIDYTSKKGHDTCLG